MFPIIMGHNQWFNGFNCTYSGQMPVVMPLMPQSATIRTVVKVERDEENSTARQNPQAPPTLAVPANDDLNNQMQNQMTAYTHREQRRVSYQKNNKKL